jgi:hypothetical protein
MILLANAFGLKRPGVLLDAVAVYLAVDVAALHEARSPRNRVSIQVAAQLLTAPTSRISLTVWASGCNTGTEPTTYTRPLRSRGLLTRAHNPAHDDASPPATQRGRGPPPANQSRLAAANPVVTAIRAGRSAASKVCARRAAATRCTRIG